MRKGISPIVAVVLLIAISVIAAVGLYFWVGGLATKQPTPDTPRTINAYMVSCNETGNSTVQISNTSPSGLSIAGATLRTSWVGGMAGAGNHEGNDSCPPEALQAGAQTTCILVHYVSGSGAATIYGLGNQTSSIVASAVVNC